MLTMPQFLDQFIQGAPGYYFFNFDVCCVTISGGYFSRKKDARLQLLAQLDKLLGGAK